MQTWSMQQEITEWEWAFLVWKIKNVKKKEAYLKNAEFIFCRDDGYG
jgi:hypothetical protein